MRSWMVFTSRSAESAERRPSKMPFATWEKDVEVWTEKLELFCCPGSSTNCGVRKRNSSRLPPVKSYSAVHVP